MKLADVASTIVIDERKLVDYALDPDSPYGRHKARVFERALGFTKANYAALLEQIRNLAPAAEATMKEEDEFGKRFQVDITVKGANGIERMIRTGWFVPLGIDEARLSTLYVKR